MTVKRVWMALLLGAAVAWGCEKSAVNTRTPVTTAGLRYFNAVGDTGYMDMRLVDIVSFAPNTARAAFRTGGAPMGTSNGTFSPPYLPVETGAHEIRVFLDSTDLVTAETVLYDTTITFKQGWNYTFILYGSARAKALHSLVMVDTTMAIPADNGVWVRTINVATDTTGLGPSVDAFVTNYHNTPAGAPTLAASTYGKTSAYVRVPVDSLGAFLTRTGTTTPVVASGNFFFGTVSDTIPGSLVKNTAFSIVVLPRSTPGAGMPTAYATPGVFMLIDQTPQLTQQ